MVPRIALATAGMLGATMLSDRTPSPTSAKAASGSPAISPHTDSSTRDRSAASTASRTSCSSAGWSESRYLSRAGFPRSAARVYWSDGEVGEHLAPADIKQPDRHRIGRERRDDLRVRGRLLVFGRRGRSLEEQEFRTEEPDAVCP